MKITNGRPSNIDNRQERELRVYDFLEQLGIEYQQVDHEPAETMEACIEVDRILETNMCKNLFLCNRQKTKFYLLMMPGEKPFKTKEISAQINSARLSFASEEYMVDFLDIHPGAVSVLGLMNDHEKQVQLLMDEDVNAAEYIGCHPCVNTSSLKIKTTDIVNKFLTEIGHEPIVVHLTGEA